MDISCYRKHLELENEKIKRQFEKVCNEIFYFQLLFSLLMCCFLNVDQLVPSLLPCLRKEPLHARIRSILYCACASYDTILALTMRHNWPAGSVSSQMEQTKKKT